MGIVFTTTEFQKHFKKEEIGKDAISKSAKRSPSLRKGQIKTSLFEGMTTEHT